MFFVKLLKKIICAILFAFFLFGFNNAFGIYFNMTGGEGSPEYKVSCARSGRSDVIEIGGGIGSYYINHLRIDKHIITNTLLCQSTVCEITTLAADKYLLEFEKKVPHYWDKWFIKRLDGSSDWVMVPYEGPEDIYRRRIYIRKAWQQDAWIIESECTVGYHIITRPLAVVHFGPEVYGETIDMINFLTAIVHYPEFSNFIDHH